MPPKRGSVTELTNTFDTLLAENVTTALRILLESKHLYQSERVEVPTLIEKVTMNAEEKRVLRDFADRSWIVSYGMVYAGRGMPSIKTDQSELEVSPLYISPPRRARLYCRDCNRLEPFHPSNAKEIGTPSATTQITRQRVLIQNYELSYACQGCCGIPEVFLVRREGYKLSLCGRSPIEHIDVPGVIPKDIRKFYSDSVVAFQSGQVLAANFLLRVMIEQWVIRNIPQPMEAADKNLEAYVATLPEGFRSTIPTLRDQYGKLSTDIHSATGSSELFESSQADVIRHFEARRLWEL